MKWGWLARHNGKVQDETFDCAEDAIDVMIGRIGLSKIDSRASNLKKIMDIGYNLCQCEIIIRPIFIVETYTGESK